MPKKTNNQTLSKRWTRARSVAAIIAILLGISVVGVMHAAASANAPLVVIPPAKATILARSDQAIATAQASHPQKPTNAAPPSAQPTATLTAGIFVEHQGPFSNSDFSIANVYRGPFGPSWVVVYAGTAWTNYPTTGSGALRVYTLNKGFIGTFTAPGNTTYIKITAVSSATLTLKTNTGALLHFDMVTDTFTS